MHLRDFIKAGHTPSLISAFLYFDISFMIWVLLGSLVNEIAPELQLTNSQRGYVLAMAPLGGAFLRIILGILSDYIGPKRTGILGMAFTLVPLVLGWQWADSFTKLIIVGLLLGFAGASFAVALPMASRWYPPKYQGLALGIAGAGNSGTAFATLFGPILAKEIGWHAVFALALIPLGLVFIFFTTFAKDAPNQPKPKSAGEYFQVLSQRDAWLFCIFYTVTFGGFLGFCLFLNTYFVKQFSVSKITAGYLATACVISGSFVRPIGGYLADRFGGVTMLSILFFAIGASMGFLALGLPIYLALPVLFMAMAFFGMGNGSVFQLVPLRFPREIGILTGLAGAAGGMGGFFLNIILGNIKDLTNSYAWGFAIFSAVAFFNGVVVLALGKAWIAQPGVQPAVPGCEPETVPPIAQASPIGEVSSPA